VEARIQRIDVFAVPITMTSVFTLSTGTVSRPGTKAIHVFVRVTGDDGTVGWGECRPAEMWSYETARTVVATIRHHLAPALVGRDPFDLVGAHEAMSRAILRGTTTGQPIAKSAVDLALHDWIGRKTGLPLWRLLGGSKREVVLSYTITAHTPEGAACDVQEGRRRGYRHFNFKVGAEARGDIVLARALRELVGPDAYLWADANGGYDLPTARRVAREFERIGVDVLEQPLRPGDLIGLRRLCACTVLPIAVDEGLVSPADLLHLIHLGAIDVVVGKITRSGGLWPSRQIYDLGRAAGLPLLLSGLADATCTLLCAASLASAYAVTSPCALNGPQFLDDWTHVGEPAVAGDRVLLSDRPGHGAVLDVERIEREAAALGL